MNRKAIRGSAEELRPSAVLQKTATASKGLWMAPLKPQTIARITVTISHRNTLKTTSVPNRCWRMPEQGPERCRGWSQQKETAMKEQEALPSGCLLAKPGVTVPLLFQKATSPLRHRHTLSKTINRESSTQLLPSMKTQ